MTTHLQDIEEHLVTTQDVLTDIVTRAIKNARADPLQYPNRLLTESEAAAMIGVKGQTMAVWRTKSTGPAYYKVGSNVRYRKDDIEKYLTTNRIDR
jgi:hypothetical protein